MYDWCCNFDVKSEYPNAIMMLNISPETLVGQFETPETNAIIKASKNGWRDFTGVVEYHSILEANEFSSDLTLKFDDKTIGSMKKSPDKWNEFFSNGDFALTANGTVFSTEKEGYIPILLRKWFSERKEYQSNAKKYKKELEAFISNMPILEETDFDITIDEDDTSE
jgi:DNA polymerase elongation subunit (family B)